MSLCVCRLPSRFTEPAFAKAHREWLQDWESRTDSRLNIAEGLVYLRTPGHFLPSVEERARKDRVSADRSTEVHSHANEIDQLLADEGIPELAAFGAKGTSEELGDARNTDRKEMDSQSQSDSTLWLVVRYKIAPTVWTFPFTHRRHTDSTFSTLTRICVDQIGLNPHIPGLAPIACRKLNPVSASGDLSSRVFYYHGLHVPRSQDARIPKDSDILEFDWVTRTELQKRLPQATWVALRDALPMDGTLSPSS